MRSWPLSRYKFAFTGLSLSTSLILLGLSAYLYLGLAARSLEVTDFADLAVLWTLFTIVGPGLFSPIELELGRSIADHRARGQTSDQLVRRALSLSAGLVVALLLTSSAVAPLIVDRLLGGSWLLFVALVLTYPSIALAHVSRGMLAGHEQYGRYAAQLALEGLLRIAGTTLCVAGGVSAPGVFGLLLGSSSLLAISATWPRRPPAGCSGPAATWASTGAVFTLLILSSGLSQVLVNSGPLIVKLLAVGSAQTLAGPLLVGIVVTRLPLFLFTAVQVVLLPRLAQAVAAGDRVRIVAMLRLLLSGVALSGVATTAVVATVGPRLLEVAFGIDWGLPPWVLPLLALGSTAYMAAVVLNHALIALRAYQHATAAWALGVGAGMAVVAFADDVLTRAVVSFGLGCLVTFVALGIALTLRLRHGLTL